MADALQIMMSKPFLLHRKPLSKSSRRPLGARYQTVCMTVFRAGQPSKLSDGTDLSDELIATEIGPIDLESIMMYGSLSYAAGLWYAPTLTKKGEKGSQALSPVNEYPPLV